jgi:hypothetical protein
MKVLQNIKRKTLLDNEEGSGAMKREKEAR